MIRTTSIRIARAQVDELTVIPELVESRMQSSVLRWCIGKATPRELEVEVTTCGDDVPPAPVDDAEGHSSAQCLVNLIPTGIGCSVGGFAGDAAPATNLLAACADYLITNPNAVNGSNFVALRDNVLYTEGSLIDLFCAGRIRLSAPFANRVGLVLDAADRQTIDSAVDVANAVRAIHGVDVVGYVVADEPIGGRCVRMPSGAYSGTLEGVGALFDACERLLRAGATALAIATNVEGLPPDDYSRHFAGDGPNPVGGTEAIISHLVCRRFRVPAAHAPLVNFREFAVAGGAVDPRAAGEAVSESGLPSVLIGLRRAPAIARPGVPARDVVVPAGVLAVVTPATALGGPAVLYAHRRGVPIVAVRENTTILDVTAEQLGLGNVVVVGTYAEAAGICLALREGISLESLRRPLRAVRELREPRVEPRVGATPVAVGEEQGAAATHW